MLVDIESVMVNMVLAQDVVVGIGDGGQCILAKMVITLSQTLKMAHRMLGQLILETLQDGGGQVIGMLQHFLLAVMVIILFKQLLGIKNISYTQSQQFTGKYTKFKCLNVRLPLGGVLVFGVFSVWQFLGYLVVQALCLLQATRLMMNIVLHSQAQ